MAEACTLTFRLTESPKPAGQQLRAKWRCGAGVWAGSLEPALSSQSPAAAQWCAPQRGLKRGRFSAQDLVDYIALDAGQAPLHPVVFEGQFFMV